MSANFTIRDATLADAAALARVHVQAFDQTHGRGPDAALRERQWRDKLKEPGKLVFCVLLENAGGELIGFASGEPNSGSSVYAGVLDKVYLLREYHRRGLGRRLLCAAAERFTRHGINSMQLFGDARSPANLFHEAMGGVRLYAGNGEFHGGYGWPDLSTFLERCRETGGGYDDMDTQPHFEERTAQHYVGIPIRTSVAEVQHVVPDRFNELNTWLSRHQLSPAGAPFVRYREIEMPHRLEIEVCVPVSGPYPADGPVIADLVPAGRYAVLVHHGGPEELIAANARLQQWADRENVRFRVHGTGQASVWECRIETYYEAAAPHTDGDVRRVEIAYLLE